MTKLKTNASHKENKRSEIVRTAHSLAMNHAMSSDKEAKLGNTAKAKEYILKAYRCERRAAMLLKNTEIEPTRSVLFRSAATLALQAELPKEAEQLAVNGLTGNPPNEISQELLDVLTQATKT